MTKARELSDYTGLQADLALKSPVASPVFTGGIDVTGAVNSTGEMRITNPSATSQLYLYGAAGQKANIILNEYGVRAWNIGSGTFTSGQFSISDGSTEHMRIDQAGNVKIGGDTIATGYQSNGLTAFTNGETTLVRDGAPTVTITRKSSGGRTVDFFNDTTISGSISVNGSSVTYGTSSDYRLKENVTSISGATAQTKLLKPCNFDWITGGNVNGFLAHELAEVVPEAVTGTKDAMCDEEYEVTAATDTEAAVMGTRSVPDMQGIDQAKLVPLLTATIQELIARIEALEGE